MLDDEERSVLEETERALTLNDPDLARRMRGERPRRRGGPGVAVLVVALVLVGGLLWLGLPGHALVVGLLAAAFLALIGVRLPSWLRTWPDDDRPRNT